MPHQNVPGLGDQKVSEAIYIDKIERGGGDPKHVSEFVKVFGWMNIAHQEVVLARDFKLKTLEGLVLTVESGKIPARDALIVSKWVYHKGHLDNWATIHIWNYNGTAMDAPTYGSTHINFIAWGE